MSNARMTADEMAMSLTGFDEVAIERHFDGFDIYTGGEQKGIRALRALVFVQKRRDGMTDPDAFQAVMGMPLSACNDFFLPAEVELDPDEPETPSGEGSAPSA